MLLRDHIVRILPQLEEQREAVLLAVQELRVALYSEKCYFAGANNPIRSLSGELRSEQLKEILDCRMNLINQTRQLNSLDSSISYYKKKLDQLDADPADDSQPQQPIGNNGTSSPVPSSQGTVEEEQPRNRRRRVTDLNSFNMVMMEDCPIELQTVYSMTADSSPDMLSADDDDDHCFSGEQLMLLGNEQSLRPFCIVEHVLPESIAWRCGLKRHDKILKFGHLTAADLKSNFEILLSAKQFVGETVCIQILRNGFEYDVVINDSDWMGECCIGAHLSSLQPNVQQ